MIDKYNYSPFFIIDDFLSPLLCEDIIQRLNHTYPDCDKDDVPLKTIKFNKLTEIRVEPLLERYIEALENYYSFETLGILPFKFEWFVEGFRPELAKSAAFSYDNNKRKWTRNADIGISGVVFLNDYNDKAPFDDSYEVYGGKLEFPTHNFGFNPKRGTAIFYPEAPNFVNATSEIQVGELNQIRIHIVPTELYNYDIKKFPGNYTTWFK